MHTNKLKQAWQFYVSVKHFIWAKIMVSREKKMLYFIEQRLIVWQLNKVSDPLYLDHFKREDYNRDSAKKKQNMTAGVY